MGGTIKKSRRAAKTRRVLLRVLFAALVFTFARAPLAGQARSAAALYHQGRSSMLAEEWYGAAESFLEALRLSPSHAEATGALAECYYELGEFDQALAWIRKARGLARGSLDYANVEGRILIALGQLDAAARVIGEVLRAEPYNKDALFAMGEMDVARGRSGDAVLRYREAARRYPDDKRVLLSLALVSGSLGRYGEARSYMDRILAQHPEDYRVFYYAAYLDSRQDRLAQAIAHAERALVYRPAFGPARSLLANLRYRSGQYAEAARLADEIIAAGRGDINAWYLKGMAYTRLGRSREAVTTFSSAVSASPGDEFVRGALEDLLIRTTKPEEEARRRWAAWHFSRAKDFRARNLSVQALFEYRRGLRLNPYARERRDYAEILRLQGFPARFMEELRFMQDLGLGDQGIDDAVEIYTNRLASALYRRWNVDPLLVTKRHWKVAVFALPSQSQVHADAAYVVSGYLRDILAHERNIAAAETELRQSSFSSAFRTAREGGADYFLLLAVTENDRDLSLKGELFVGRTGSPAGTFYAYRTGPDRLRNASRSVADALSAALPFRGELAVRQAGNGLINKGRADAVKAGAVYDIVKKGRLSVQNEGIALVYAEADLVGTLTISEADEEVAAGALARTGFFDRIEAGDEIILHGEKSGAPPPAAGAAPDPELRALLRALR
ncbi:MAG: tetratricopeptide repeat protein [Treponema sp.]|nr:tetratricopeptide repeat protein [Treponema sp.]